MQPAIEERSKKIPSYGARRQHECDLAVAAELDPWAFLAVWIIGSGGHGLRPKILAGAARLHLRRTAEEAVAKCFLPYLKPATFGWWAIPKAQFAISMNWLGRSPIYNVAIPVTATAMRIAKL